MSEEEKRILDNNLFLKHIISLENGAWMFLGKISNPVTGKIEKNTSQVKNIIDTLMMIREKTKGNLSEKEDKILNDVITQIQYNFVEETILNKKNKGDSKNNSDNDSYDEQKNNLSESDEIKSVKNKNFEN